MGEPGGGGHVLDPRGEASERGKPMRVPGLKE